MEELYIVKYSIGHYDDWGVTDIFVTNNKSKATKYVTKFNRLVKKWCEYYNQFEDDSHWIKDEYVEQHFQRWIWFRDIEQCYYEIIDVR